MANPVLAEESFEVDGQTYTFAFGHYAMAALERKVQKPIHKFLARKSDDFGMDEILSIFHAGLLRHHKGLTEEEAADLADALTTGRVVDIVGKAIRQAFGSGEGANGAARPRRTPKSGIGSGSSVSGQAS